ncbi:hypothetical protein KY338_06955 [Candidatus Woesearchaeota archaeon]|nr:hypothetical protein [Candidatus Woesearchaeota archaeon]MBW3006265.1 hypothetical protein [Candidatus Woesearchaeota archaeon]
MSTKTLVGVLHDDSNRDEMRQVLDLINDTNAATIGLEITNKDSELRDCGPFFDRLHDYTIARGARAVPLEHQLAHDRYAVINAAITVLEGTLCRENLEFVVQYTTDELKQRIALKPQQIRNFEESKKTAVRALKLLDKNLSQEEITRMYNEANAEREKHMLSRIQRHKPDLVIIGVAHAEAIRDSIPEYQFVSLAKQDAEGIFEE